MNTDLKPHSLLEKYRSSLRLEGKSNATLEAYTRDASEFLEFLTALDLDLRDTELYMLKDFQTHRRVKGAESHNSVRRKIISIRLFYRFLVDQGLIESSPFESFILPGRHDFIPSLDQLAKVDELLCHIDQHDKGLRGTRDRALIYLVALEGLKAQELIDILWDDFLGQKLGLHLGIKGPKSRIIQLSKQTIDAINLYRQEYASFAKTLGLNDLGTMPFAIQLHARSKTGVLPMSRHGLKGLIYDLGAAVGLNHANAELLRHYAMATRLVGGEEPRELLRHFGLRQMGNLAKHLGRIKNKPDSANF